MLILVFRRISVFSFILEGQKRKFPSGIVYLEIPAVNSLCPLHPISAVSSSLAVKIFKQLLSELRKGLSEAGVWDLFDIVVHLRLTIYMVGFRIPYL
jgi:hypothetical protein